MAIKTKQTKYQVSFLLRVWVSVNVETDNEDEARKKATEILNKLYDRNDVEFNDGKMDFIGITNLTILDKLED